MVAHVAGICNPSFLYYQDLQSVKFKYYIKIVIFAIINIFCGKYYGLKILIINYEVITIIPFGHDRWFTSDVREVLTLNESIRLDEVLSIVYEKISE